jgi:hypothetical protein
MTQHKVLVAVLVGGTFLSCGGAWAATQQSPADQKPSKQQAAADQDFGKLSSDAARGFQDITLTRLAIFDGRTDAAKKYVVDAESAFGKAKTDGSVFNKAEADLRPAGQNSTMKAGKSNATTSGSDKTPSDQAQMNKSEAWLPVDAAMSVDEDFSASPSKAAAVADANNSLRSGDRGGAIEKLKLAEADVAISLAVVPLNQTIDDVHQAASLINDGKYYEGSQLLRKVINSERYDVAVIGSEPKSGSQAPASGASKEPAKAQ